MSQELKVDLAVIGAGLYGIQAARTYLEIHPNHDVTVFEASDCVGGVWSRERVYDGFWTQTPLGIAEFSDMPLEGMPVTDEYYGFFPAKYMARYLEQYVATRSYSGSTLRTRISLESKVYTLTKTRDGWTLKTRHRDGDSLYETSYCASKVIDATGLTSTPNMPSLSGRELFTGTVAHHLEFGKLQKEIVASSQYQNIIVIGGAKSAADMAYVCAKAGKSVSWIIRRDGAGPAAFVSAKGSAMYKNSNESFYTRFTSHFLASLYMDETKTLLGRFLYRTRVGQWLLKYTWSGIDAKAHQKANYDRQDGKSNQYYNLRPDTPLFWQNDSTGICQSDDFFNIIASHVKVYRDNIIGMTESGVTLADGTVVQGDLILCGTGWEPSHPNIVDSDGNDIKRDLGLASDSCESSTGSERAWKEMEMVASNEILTRFPVLRNPPIRANQAPDTTPLRLWKGILPIHDQSIAFVGQLLLGNNFRVAEVQALFAVAALDGRLQLPPVKIMQQDIAKHNAWSQCRYLKKGAKGNWLYWDMVPYTDHLLSYLGMQSHRPHGWFRQLFSTCFARDLSDVINEYKSKYGSIRVSTEGQSQYEQS